MYKVSKYMYLAMAAVALICGFMLTFNPGNFANSVCRIIGVIAVLGGIMQLMEDKNARTPFSRSGIITLVAGALLLIAPSLVLRFISIFAGIGLVIYCIPKLRYAMDSKKLGTNGWEVALGLSVGGIAIGALLILGDASIAHIIVRLLGIALIALGGWMGFTLIRGEY